MRLDKETVFAINMQAYQPEVYLDMSDADLRALSSALRMAIRLGLPARISTIVPMAIVKDIWGDMLDPMPLSVLQEAVEAEHDLRKEEWV